MPSIRSFCISIVVGVLLSGANLTHDFPEICDYRTVSSEGVDLPVRIEMQAAWLLDYRPQALIERGVTRPILTMKASLIKENSRISVRLPIRFNSTKVYESYGMIKYGSFLNVQLMDGSHVFLKHAFNNGLLSQPKKNSLSFTATFDLDKRDIKKILQKEIDVITVTWDKGIEMYEILDVDIFRQQLSCLLKI